MSAYSCPICRAGHTSIKGPARNWGHWHNVLMIYSAGDLGIEIDLGSDEPGSILQRYAIDGWKDYLIDGEPVISPVDVNALPSGQYRLRKEENPSAEPEPW